ncbi:YqgE/AlgH family protein [Novosphingobium profundi]|uniref:YqgE/AlgH family protein n=1 Tax=Novosphingobium profundi TaxID=1774954 RepID=UPI001CFC7787|nr:YqgE/AlgH family protein [Novosphingobium profundi]
MEGQYLAGRMLLAMPGMFDPRFERSVNVLCVHDEHGALGINVGEAREGVTFHAILDDLGLDTALAPDCAVLNGGPVEPGRGFVLHSLDWGGGDSIEVHAQDGPLCALSASMDILRAIAQGRGPSQWVMALGYAGWAPGQLEEEMRHHGWYAAQGSREVLFDTSPEARWAGAWKHEGIDPGLLSSQTGNA